MHDSLPQSVYAPQTRRAPYASAKECHRVSSVAEYVNRIILNRNNEQKICQGSLFKSPKTVSFILTTQLQRGPWRQRVWCFQGVTGEHMIRHLAKYKEAFGISVIEYKLSPQGGSWKKMQ